MLGSEGFDLWADGYDRAVGVSDEDGTYPFAGYKKVLGSIFDSVMRRPGASVLDLGFGTGTLTVKLHERGFQVFGQDFSPRMTELARAKMPGAELYTCDLNEGLAAPLTRRSYDFMIATYSLHHFDDARKIGLIKELLGLLNEGGEMLIGDVAFGTRAELEECRKTAGDEWDDEEFYFVADEFKKAFPDLTFEKASFCSGVIRIPKS